MTTGAAGTTLEVRRHLEDPARGVPHQEPGVPVRRTRILDERSDIFRMVERLRFRRRQRPRSGRGSAPTDLVLVVLDVGRGSGQDDAFGPVALAGVEKEEGGRNVRRDEFRVVEDVCQDGGHLLEHVARGGLAALGEDLGDHALVALEDEGLVLALGIPGFDRVEADTAQNDLERHRV